MDYRKQNQEILNQVIVNVRRRIFLLSYTTDLIRIGLFLLPLAAVLILAAKFQGIDATAWIAWSTALFMIVVPFIRSVRFFRSRVESALSLDHFAHLKDRITSAYEFLGHPAVNIPEEVQIQDAVRHARSLNLQQIIPSQYPRYSEFLPAALLFFYMSLFIPTAIIPDQDIGIIDPIKQEQLQELAMLEQELLMEEEQPEELEQLLDDLRKMKKRFEDGEISERDVMIELARMDKDLMQKVKEMGVDQLQGELNEIVPHLMSAAAAVQVANAIKEQKLDKAAEELEKLSEKVKKNELTDKEKRELAMNMGVVASKLGGKQDGSFGGDFANATEALESSNSKKFAAACKNMGNKLNMMCKAKKICKACNKLGSCKSCLGQCNGVGIALGPKKKASNGSKSPNQKAGTGVTGNPFGEGTVLNDSLRKMLHIAGQAGDGPVETEIEITEGQLSQSQVDIKDVQRNFAQVAEEAIEDEAIPLSHRYHVKRYFQSIHPQE